MMISDWRRFNCPIALSVEEADLRDEDGLTPDGRLPEESEERAMN